MTLTALVAVAAGGAAAVLRYLVSVAFVRARSGDAGPGFPWAVLIVNVVGSAFGGAVLALGLGTLSPDAQLVLLAGVCGGLTTFSAFSVDTVQLLRARRTGLALASVGANLVLGVAACAFGFALFGGGTGV